MLHRLIETVRESAAPSGFELYLRDASRGGELWERVAESGAPFGIGPGTPNPVERIESGLLSFGGDTGAEVRSLRGDRRHGG